MRRFYFVQIKTRIKLLWSLKGHNDINKSKTSYVIYGRSIKRPWLNSNAVRIVISLSPVIHRYSIGPPSLFHLSRGRMRCKKERRDARVFSSRLGFVVQVLVVDKKASSLATSKAFASFNSFSYSPLRWREVRPLSADEGPRRKLASLVSRLPLP